MAEKRQLHAVLEACRAASLAVHSAAGLVWALGPDQRAAARLLRCSEGLARSATSVLSGAGPCAEAPPSGAALGDAAAAAAGSGGKSCVAAVKGAAAPGHGASKSARRRRRRRAAAESRSAAAAPTRAAAAAGDEEAAGAKCVEGGQDNAVWPLPDGAVLFGDLSEFSAAAGPSVVDGGSGAGALQSLRVGDEVVVLSGFCSDTEGRTSRIIPPGSRGSVVSVDPAGDAEVLFEGGRGKEWVFREKFQKLKVVRQRQ